MKIFRFRILIDHAHNVFRDIEIQASGTFQELHESILQSFAFSGQEMSSFYLSNDEWDKGAEIAQMDFSEPGQEPVRMMADTILEEVLESEGSKLLYLYDFLRMWIWYVELVEVRESAEDPTQLPRVVLSVGDAPSEFSKGMIEKFESEGDDDPFTEFEDDFDPNDFDSYGEDPYP